MRLLFILVRLAIVGAVGAAVIAQLARSYEFTVAADGDVAAMIVNFFSYFTIDSNVLAGVAAAVGSVVLLGAKAEREPTWLTTLRLAAVTYMTVTLVVYNTLLRGLEVAPGVTVGWSNEILHVAAPVLVLIDWLFAPGRTRLEWNRLWAVVIFPVVWTAYTLIRGPIVAWYPYPFMNPASSENGYLSVAFYVLLITGVFLATAAGAIRISRRWETAPIVEK